MPVCRAAQHSPPGRKVDRCAQCLHNTGPYCELLMPCLLVLCSNCLINRVPRQPRGATQPA